MKTYASNNSNPQVDLNGHNREVTVSMPVDWGLELQDPL